jgi:D-psicose/D-tagatose/L-ribulose 3-epimerase
MEGAYRARIGILFDTFCPNSANEDFDAALRLCSKHVKHIHTCENDRGARIAAT